MNLVIGEEIKCNRCGKTIIVTPNMKEKNLRRCWPCSRINRPPEYTNWECMIKRCHYPKNQNFKYYGAKGIKVCERWRKSFKTFLADVGPKPTPKHTLDRFPNKKGDYEPGNVRWATMEDQARNRSLPVSSLQPLTANGETKTLREWAEIIGARHWTIRRRIKDGWPVDKAVTTPPSRNGRLPSGIVLTKR